MIDKLRALAAFTGAAEAMRADRPRAWIHGLWGASRGLLALELAVSLDRGLLLVTPTTEAAEAAMGDLESFLDSGAPRLFPPREYLPPSAALPADRGVYERMLALRILLGTDKRPPVIVAPIRSLLQYLPPPGLIAPMLLRLEIGATWSHEQLSEALVEVGYRRQSIVENRGEFSIKGGIIDIFPICAEDPCRLEFVGDDIESIRLFDAVTQLSFEKIERVGLMPRNSWIDSAGPSGDEATLLDFLPPETIVAWDEPLRIEETASGKSLAPMYEIAREKTATLDRVVAGDTRPMLCLSRLEQSSEIFTGFERFGVQCHSLEPLTADLGDFMGRLSRWLDDGFSAAIICNNEGESKRLMELLQDAGMNPHFSPRPDRRRRLSVALGNLRSGFSIDEIGLVVASDQEIFRRYARRRPRKKYRGGTPIASFADLRVGDYIVHVDHGIGVYRGLVRLEDQKSDFLVLEYLDGDKLYVPVGMMRLVQKYVGSDEEPPRIYKLGGTAWFRTQERVRRCIRDMAGELLEMYAARKVLPGVECSPDSEWQGEFEEAFIYRETEDQLAAIGDIKADMERGYPMDRLICGDVGYGKTEVALRAAFKCVMDSRQVAVLVPTTILAQQHYTTFRERLADYPVRVEMLSRFKTAAEQKKIVGELAEGKVDIVIGTHRLVQNDVTLKDLGLVVVDEEQRFGVAHKERLKKLRKLVDVLTLTATPIPRTLHMALMGAKDMSVIGTAPEERLSVVTVVAEFGEKLIHEAILREMAREGQVFFVHNRIQSIDRMAGFVRRLAPEARVGIAHGRMPERELQQTMELFLEKEIDVLMCTTIIESGLDIPNVNTMLINRADRFGLADLYQLRGRVGRYKRRAYAYLLIPGRRALTEVAQKRLKAIEEFSELGSGFKIALRDLEIRGAGNILGAEQHGDISAVGFELYCRLLEEAVNELKGEKPEKALLPTVELGVDSFISDDYVSSPAQKLSLYKKVGLAKTEEGVDLIMEEMRDRYGPVPRESENLVNIARLRIVGGAGGLEFIGKVGDKILFRPVPGKQYSSAELAALSDAFGKTLRLETDGGVRLVMPIREAGGRDILDVSTEVTHHIARLRSGKDVSEPNAAK
jgi:transcription-repair coupling factor (superfamily II helicase)